MTMSNDEVITCQLPRPSPPTGYAGHENLLIELRKSFFN